MKFIHYECGRCHELLQVTIENSTNNCICPNCQFVEIPAPPRSISTNSKLSLLGKAFLINFTVAILMGGLFSGLLPLLPIYLISSLATDSIYKNDRDYQEFKKRGGSVFWDSFLGGGHAPTYYTMPNPEPDYTDFVPPGHWKYQCLTCNARVATSQGFCWNCNTQFDG